LTFAVQKKIDR